MSKHVIMIIANSPKPAYFNWFADFAIKENIKLTQVYLCLNKLEIPIKELQEKNVNVIWFHFDYRKSKPLQYIKLFIKLFYLFLKLKPDAVQTNLFDDSLPALFAAKICGIKRRILTKQDTGYHINYLPKFIKYDNFNNKNATDVIAVSNETYNLIKTHEKNYQNKLAIIHHAINEDNFKNFDTNKTNYYKLKYNLENKFVVATISRYVKSKGYIELINAFKILIKQNNLDNIVFLGIGIGPDEKALKKIIEEYELSNHFILTGKIPHEDISSIFRCMNIYIHAAHYEPFGFVIAEAMFSQTPIITTKVGAAADALVHLESAYLLPDNSPEEIAKAIIFMQSANTKIMSNKAFEIANQKFAKHIMWNNYKKLFIK